VWWGTKELRRFDMGKKHYPKPSKHKKYTKVEIDQDNYAEVYTKKGSKVEIDQDNEAIVVSKGTSDIDIDQNNSAYVVVL
jgi:hypothetical protein